MITTGLFYNASMIAYLVVCAPTDGQSQFAYISALASPRCTQTRRPLAVIQGAVNVISDLYLIILPLPAVWSLQISFRRKISISAIFLTGMM